MRTPPFCTRSPWWQRQKTSDGSRLNIGESAPSIDELKRPDFCTALLSTLVFTIVRICVIVYRFPLSGGLTPVRKDFDGRGKGRPFGAGGWSYMGRSSGDEPCSRGCARADL